MDPILLRPIEAARLMGLGRSKIYDLAAAGEIPVVRIGKSIRIPMEALRRWIETHTSEVEQRAAVNAVDVTKTSR